MAIAHISKPGAGQSFAPMCESQYSHNCYSIPWDQRDRNVAPDEQCEDCKRIATKAENDMLRNLGLR